jgi:hypothetical protein
VDLAYQRCLIGEQVEQLRQEFATGLHPHARLESGGDLTILRLDGRGPDEPYQVKIEPASYPVGPWRISFIDPALDGAERLRAPDRDPRFWPYSQIPGVFGGFHIHFPGPYRVFVCRPYTTEYFYYHPEEAWRPDIYDLPAVFRDLEKNLQDAVHFSRWWDGLYRDLGS